MAKIKQKTIKKLTVQIIIGIAVVLLGFLLFKNPSLLFAAKVNGKLVSRWELEKRFVSRYASQTIDEIVNEQLILQEGQKKGIVVTDKDITDKISKVEKSLGGKISLKDALVGQGLSMTEFTLQVRLQLTLEKLAASNIILSDKDVDDYLVANRATMSATDEAGLKDEARQTLLMQKKNEALRNLFQNLKGQAKITKYL